MRIEKYSFGHMTIDGVDYDKDLLLTRDQIFPNWWRKEGHRLAWEDFATVVEQVKPQVIVVGKGRFGMMRLNPETSEELEKRNIQLIAVNTADAVTEFNTRVTKQHVLGAFHLTC